MKHHIISFHSFNRGLLINFCTILAGIEMPVAVEVANPVNFGDVPVFAHLNFGDVNFGDVPVFAHFSKFKS